MRHTSLRTHHRRRFLQDTARLSAAVLAGGLVDLPSLLPGTASTLAATLRDNKACDIVDIRRTTVSVPYRAVPERNMARELPHWTYAEIFQVELASGAVGVGETLLYYTWGVSGDNDVTRVRGQNAAEWMWDDSLGAGLQMALLDAVARTADVPIHALLGSQVNERTPLSWWNIDTSAADMASECRTALDAGYMAYKTKGRPWYDVREQVRQACAVVPEAFKIDMDFNDTLLDAQRGIPILEDLAKYPQVGIYESPIPQGDVPGNQAIRRATRVPVAMHYGTPEPVVAIREDVCDGFVIGGGATSLIEAAHVSAMADKPFWLQLVGTGITAAFSLHFGGVLSHATWPAVNCHQLYQHDLLADPIVVRDGFAAVPAGPGLGHAIDWDAVQRYRVEKPAARPDPPRILETTWPDGRRMYVANSGEVNFMLNLGIQGRMPYYVDGADTRLLPNDGSQKWQDLHRRASGGPVFEG